MITTEAEASKFEQRDRLSEAIAESMIWGSDRTDRFQTAARWRGEPSPKIVSAAGDETAERIKLPPGWSTWRFLRPGWPENDSFVYLIDVKTRIISGWIIAGSWLIALLGCRRRLVRWRFLVLTSVMAGSLFVEWFLPSRLAGYSAAIFAGTLVVLILELGRRASQLRCVRTESRVDRKARWFVAWGPRPSVLCCSACYWGESPRFRPRASPPRARRSWRSSPTKEHSIPRGPPNE